MPTPYRATAFSARPRRRAGRVTFSQGFLQQVRLNTHLSIHFLQSPIFVLRRLHLADHRRVYHPASDACTTERAYQRILIPFVERCVAHSVLAHNSDTGTPPSDWRRIARIWGSLYLAIFIKNSSVNLARKFSHPLSFSAASCGCARRATDALRENFRPVGDGAELRLAGRGNPNPHPSAQSLHGSRPTCHSGRRISPSCERRSPVLWPFAQQKPLGTATMQRLHFMLYTTSRNQTCPRRSSL